MTTTIIRIIHIVLGVFFIFSSVSKAIEIDSFAYILMSYGHKNLQFLGPLITASEFFIGLSLLLNFYVKKVTTFSLWLISIFTGLYIYGFIFLNITDCGCFGSTIKVAPIYSILKNIFLIFLLFYLSLSKYKNSYPANWKTVICSFLPLIVLTINLIEIITFQENNKIYLGNTCQELQISGFCKQKNVTVFVFNPNCIHCRELIPKLSNSKTPVVGLYSNEFTEKTIAPFKEKFKPLFPIYPIDDIILSKLTNTYPILLYFENGILKNISHDYNSDF